MPDPVRATELQPSQAFDPLNDYLMAVKGDADGPRSGPYLVPAQNVSVGSAATGGDGTGGGTTPPPATGAVTKVFGRTGPEIVAAANDYTAAQIGFDPQTSGLAASTVQEAVDAVAALRDTLPVTVSDGDVLTATGGVWSSQPPVLISIFGRGGAVDAAVGDYHADQIALVKTVGEDPNVPTDNRFVTAAQIAKLTALDTALQLPDPTAATLGHVLTVTDSAGANVWAAAAPTGGGAGGGLSQIDMFPLLKPKVGQSPNWVYSGDTATWEFNNTTEYQILTAEIDYWPGGTATINFTVSCSATSGNLAFYYQLGAITHGTTDLWDKAMSSWVRVQTTAADAAKKIKRITGTISGLDSVAEGDFVRIHLWRDQTVSSNAAGTLVLRGCTLRFS